MDCHEYFKLGRNKSCLKCHPGLNPGSLIVLAEDPETSSG